MSGSGSKPGWTSWTTNRRSCRCPSPLPAAWNLSDEFLTTIAREYLVRGRGYAASLAEEYFATPRTVVSWIEKARARGILSPPPTSGSTGGQLLT